MFFRSKFDLWDTGLPSFLTARAGPAPSRSPVRVNVNDLFQSRKPVDEALALEREEQLHALVRLWACVHVGVWDFASVGAWWVNACFRRVACNAVMCTLPLIRLPLLTGPADGPHGCIRDGGSEGPSA